MNETVISTIQNNNPSSTQGPVIKVKNLHKSFKQYKKEPGLSGSFKAIFHREYSDVPAVKDVSFEIEEGEFVGFIGPNGAGKTTTLKCLSGLLYPTSGEVSVLGYTPWDRRRSYLKQISLVMGQKNQLWWDLPAIDSFLLNKEIYQIDDDAYELKLDQLTQLLEIQDVINVQVRKLSLGERMRCELLAALLHSPKVIFLDEPTIGLDVVMQNKLRNFFKNYNEIYKTTIILTSHYMEDVKELCKRVIVIHKGRVIYDGALKNLVSTFAEKKNISVVTSRRVEQEDFAKFGEIMEVGDTHVVLSVNRKEVPQVSAQILEKLPVEDLDIREIALDDVIRKIFQDQPR